MLPRLCAPCGAVNGERAFGGLASRAGYERLRQWHDPVVRDTIQDIERLANSLRTDALIIPGDYQVEGVSADPEDDKFLACALEGQATCIVTGDPDLLNPGRYHGIEILKPHEFLERLGLLP